MKPSSASLETPIFFSKRKADDPALRNGVVLSPEPDRWNNFALRTRFDCVIVVDGVARVECVIHLAFLESANSPADRVRQIMRESPEPLRPAKDFPEFFTLMPSMEDYRAIVKTLGPTSARQHLRALNDMVEVQRRKVRPAWFSKAQRTRAFQRSFMRASESFFAFHNSPPLLAGLEHERFDGISDRWRLRFKLPTFTNRHELEFDFRNQEFLPQRIAILIGKNGTGKSRALHHIVSSALKGDKRLRGPDGERLKLGRVLAIESPGETQATFPAERVGEAGRVFYRRVALDRSGKRGLGRGLTSLFVRLSRHEQDIGEHRRWSLFQRAVNNAVPWDEIYVRLTPGIDDDEPSLRLAGRAWVSLAQLTQGGERDQLDLWARVDPRIEPRRQSEKGCVPLSSGQITFVRFAAQLCLNIENGTLLLLDEPETHLHPNLITDFVALLNELLIATGSLAIISTHSSYFVRETPNHQVLVLHEPEPGRIEVTRPRLRTLGADVGAISRFVFGDKTPSLLLAEMRNSFIDSPGRKRRAVKRLAEILPTEAMIYLERDPETEKGASL